MKDVRDEEDADVLGMFFWDLPQHFDVLIFCFIKGCGDKGAKSTSVVYAGDFMFYSR